MKLKTKENAKKEALASFLAFSGKNSRKQRENSRKRRIANQKNK